MFWLLFLYILVSGSNLVQHHSIEFLEDQFLLGNEVDRMDLAGWREIMQRYD